MMYRFYNPTYPMLVQRTWIPKNPLWRFSFDHAFTSQLKAVLDTKHLSLLITYGLLLYTCLSPNCSGLYYIGAVWRTPSQHSKSLKIAAFRSGILHFYHSIFMVNSHLCNKHISLTLSKTSMNRLCANQRSHKTKNVFF